MEIKVRKTHAFVELKVDKTETTIFKPSPKEIEDINGIEVTEGCELQYSSYTPSENVEKGKVYTHEEFGGLWVNSVPISLLHSDGLDYRKLKVL